MAETGGLFVIDAETGDVTQFTGNNITAGNGFTAHADYKNNGTYGFRSIKDDSDVNYAYGYESFSTADDLYARCYVYVSSAIRNTANANAPFLKFMAGPYTWSTNVMYVGVFFDAGGLPTEWRFYGPGAATEKSTTNFTTDAWHRIEMRYVKHATTGGCQVWVDGTKVYEDIDQDTTATSATDLFCGLFECAAVGYIWMDDIKCDTSAIGAYSSGGATVPLFKSESLGLRGLGGLNG